jgi:RNA polymerase sigma-70 factor (ECF subfamily)
VERGERAMAEPAPSPYDAVAGGESRDRVRAALDRLAERERQLLLLRAEGYAYSDIARALELNEASVGTLLARAKRAFREAWEEPVHAS